MSPSRCAAPWGVADLCWESGAPTASSALIRDADGWCRQYSGAGAGKPLPLLLATKTGTIDRGACIKDFSQYPGEASYAAVHSHARVHAREHARAGVCVPERHSSAYRRPALGTRQRAGAGVALSVLRVWGEGEMGRGEWGNGAAESALVVAS